MTDPTRFDINEILRQRVNREDQFEQDRKIINGYTIGVDSTTSPAVDGRDKFIWFREAGMNGAVHQVFNPDKIPLLIDFPCRVGHAPKEPYRWEVIDVDWDQVYYMDGYQNQNFGVGTHAPNHEWPDYAQATDVMSVYPRALAPLRTVPGSGLTVGVWAHRYFYSGVLWRFMGLAGVDLSAHQPASGLACRVLVYLEKGTNLIKTVAGSTVTDSTVITPPDPVIPAVDGILSALVRLDGDQTSFTESDIYDLRFVLNEISKKPAAASSTGVTTDELAHVEATWDFIMSAHVVGGFGGSFDEGFDEGFGS